MKKLLVLLTLLLPVHAWGATLETDSACYYYDLSYDAGYPWTNTTPSVIPSSAVKVTIPGSSIDTVGTGCDGNLKTMGYYNSRLNVWGYTTICSACTSGDTQVINTISLGDCDYGTRDAAVGYSCFRTFESDNTSGVYGTLPTSGTVTTTIAPDNCGALAPARYVRLSSNNSYAKIQSCRVCNSNYHASSVQYTQGVGYYIRYNQCVTCGRGYGLKEGSGSTSCSSCVAGTYNNGNYTYCQSASAGYYVSGTGARYQTACAAGSYASGTGNTKCTACAGGKTNSGTGNSSCTTACANSTGVNTWTTPTWSTSNTVSNLCKISKCSAGHEYNSSSATCTACPVGKYNSTAGGTCTTCPPASGVYTDSALTTNPQTTTTTTGATSVNQCAIDTFLAVYYDVSGSYSYGVDTCSYNGTGSNTSTAGTTCSGVQPYCLNNNGVSVNDFTPYSTVPAGITSSLDASGTTACWCKQNNKYMWVNSYSKDPEGCMNPNTGCAAECANRFLMGNLGASMGCTGGENCTTYRSMCLTVAGTGVVSSLPSGASAGGQYCWCKHNNKYINLYNMGSAETCSASCDFQCSEQVLNGTAYDSDMGCGSSVACSTVGSACKVTDAAWSPLTDVYNGNSPYYSDTVPSGRYCWCGINGYSFVAADMGSEGDCTENCASQCRSLLTDPDSISAYGLPAKVGCTN